MQLTISLICLYWSAGNAANILGVFTSTTPSHIIIHLATVKALAEKGHNVTIVTTLPLKERHPNYLHVHVPSSDEDNAEYNGIISKLASSSTFESIRLLVSSNVQRVRMQDKALAHPRFRELLNNSGNHFDVVILGFAFNTFQLGVAAHFKCPVILSWVNVPMNNILSLVGNPLTVASVPTVFMKSNQLKKFGRRVANFLLYGLLLGIDLFSEHKMAQYYAEHFPAAIYPSYADMRKNVSLLFCNSHFSEGTVRPMVPGLIEIGGIQIKEKPSALPKDIRGFIHKAGDDGFILFSLGSNVKSTDLSPNTTMAMFNVLSKVKQKVLWKWDGGEAPGRSPNIMFRKWFPQDDLLAHPKIRLFLTHAGKGSVAEAQYHGVPMLAIPVYGDQFMISQQIESWGHGKALNHREITKANFQFQLEEALANSSYKEAVATFSNLYRDRPITARQSVVYWTEYVIRHHGARHMQSPVVHLNFFQNHSLDVVAFLSCLLYVFAAFVRGMYALMFRRKLKID